MYIWYIFILHIYSLFMLISRNRRATLETPWKAARFSDENIIQQLSEHNFSYSNFNIFWRTRQHRPGLFRNASPSNLNYSLESKQCAAKNKTTFPIKATETRKTNLIQIPEPYLSLLPIPYYLTVGQQRINYHQCFPFFCFIYVCTTLTPN